MRGVCAGVTVLALCVLATEKTGAGCLFPKPSPQCRMYLITEWSGYYRLSPAPRMTTYSLYEADSAFHEFHFRHNRSLLMVWDFGVAANLCKKFAAGVSYYFAFGHYGSLDGFRFHVIRWLKKNRRFAVSPGWVRSASDPDLQTPCFLGTVSWGLTDWLELSSLFLYVPAHWTERTDIFRRKTAADRGFFLGARLTSKEGIIAGSAAVLTLLAVRLFLAVCGAYG